MTEAEKAEIVAEVLKRIGTVFEQQRAASIGLPLKLEAERILQGIVDGNVIST